MNALPRVLTLKPVLFVLLILPPPVALAQSAPQLVAPQCGDTIGPGGTWRIARNLHCPGDQPALRIVGPTKVEFAGAMVSCFLPGSQTIGIDVSGGDVHLADAIVDGCAVGIDAKGNGNAIRSVTVARYGVAAFQLDGDQNTLIGNRALDSTYDSDSLGFRITGDSNTVRGNTYADSLQGYAYLAFAIHGEGNRVAKNLVHQIRGRGFVIGGMRNTVRRNLVSSSRFTAFAVFGKRNRFVRNSARRTTRDDAILISGERHVAKDNLVSDWDTEERHAFVVEGSGHVVVDNTAAGRERPDGAAGCAFAYHVTATDVVQSGNQTLCE